MVILSEDVNEQELGTPVTDEKIRSDHAEGSKLSAVDTMVEGIRELIRERELNIGDPLPTERELGEMFSVGRNTVREALQVLRAFGLIETRPKVGAIVIGGQGEALRKLFSFHREVTPESFQDVQKFRSLIEIGIVDNILLKASDAQIADLHKVNERILQCSTAQEAAECDYNFHCALVDLSSNRTTSATYKMLEPVLLDIMFTGKEIRPTFQLTYDAHKEIIEALQNRDRLAYSYLLTKHLEFGLKFVGLSSSKATSDGGQSHT